LRGRQQVGQFGIRAAGRIDGHPAVLLQRADAIEQPARHIVPLQQ